MSAPKCLGGIFDYAESKDRLAEVELELAEPSVWEDPTRAQDLGRERAALEKVVRTLEQLVQGGPCARHSQRYPLSTSVRSSTS